MAERHTVYCSFCRKNQHEVGMLIAGPTVFICDECVEFFMDIIRTEREKSVIMQEGDLYGQSDRDPVD